MKVIKVSGSTATIEEASLTSWAIQSVTNPFTGNALTSSQALLFGGLALVGGGFAGLYLSKSSIGRKFLGTNKKQKSIDAEW